MKFDVNLIKKLHRGGFHRRFILFAVEAFAEDSWTCPITQKKIFWRLLHLRVVGSVKPAQVGGRRWCASRWPSSSRRTRQPSAPRTLSSCQTLTIWSSRRQHKVVPVHFLRRAASLFLVAVRYSQGKQAKCFVYFLFSFFSRNNNGMTMALFKNSKIIVLLHLSDSLVI